MIICKKFMLSCSKCENQESSGQIYAKVMMMETSKNALKTALNEYLMNI